MALATYADLLTAVQNYEDDNSSVVTDVIADMVTLAENRIFYGSGEPGDALYSPPLRVKSMERTRVIPIGPGIDGGTAGGSENSLTISLDTAPTLETGLTVTFTAAYNNTGAVTIDVEGTGAYFIKRGIDRVALDDGDILAGCVYTVYYDGSSYVLMPSDGAAPLPSNFLGIKSAYLQDRATILTFISQSGVNIEMDGATADTPAYYTIEGDCIRLSPLPAEDCKVVLTYYERPAALSSSVNRIYADAPGVYLFATLMELADYLTSEERAQKWFAKYRAAMGGYQSAMARSASTYGNTRVSFRTAP